MGLKSIQVLFKFRRQLLPFRPLKRGIDIAILSIFPHHIVRSVMGHNGVGHKMGVVVKEDKNMDVLIDFFDDRRKCFVHISAFKTAIHLI